MRDPTHGLSAELGSLVPGGNGSRTGIQNRESVWQVKLHARVKLLTRMQAPPSRTGTPPPPPRTTCRTARRNLGITGYRRNKQGFWRKNQGLDGKPGKWETPRNRRRRYNNNIKNKPVASSYILQKTRYIYIYIYLPFLSKAKILFCATNIKFLVFLNRG